MRGKETEIGVTEEVQRCAKVGRGEIGLLRAKGISERVVLKLRDLIGRYRAHYDTDRIATFGSP